MKTTDLKKNVENPKYIPGIYNYCDRWCERCQFTSRCLNCTLAEKQFGGLQEIDQFNDEFWEKFNEVLEDTLTMVQEIALEYGFDPDLFSEMPDDPTGAVTTENNKLTHLITHASDAYAEMVEEWFDSNEFFFDKKEDEMMLIRLITPGNNPEKEVANINDAAEVIRWYQYQISVKIQRAIRSVTIEKQSGCDDVPPKDSDKDSPQNSTKDSDGSAKVALIGIERSIAAWKMLLNSFPELEKQIIDLNLFLNSILKRVETQFPRARSFVRPGFDEIGVTVVQ